MKFQESTNKIQASPKERKGLRFEVYKRPIDDGSFSFDWKLIGAGDVPVATSPEEYSTEKEARSNVASAKKRFKASGMVKVLTIDEGTDSVVG